MIILNQNPVNRDELGLLLRINPAAAAATRFVRRAIAVDLSVVYKT